MPAVPVTIANEGTGASRDIRTNESGIFRAPNLPVGSYTIRVAAPGFRIEERSHIALSANQVLEMDVKLNVAETVVTQEVTAQAPLIDTQTSTLAYAQNARELENVPLVTRTNGGTGLYGYTLLNPGVSKQAVRAVPAVNGMRALNTYPTMDGIGVMSFLDGVGGGPVQPSLEAVQEVNVQLANPQAEFARSTNFTVVTKAGTNELRGSAFWGYNTHALNARAFFDADSPFRVYNNFGGNAGGPIVRNKLFFFGAFEGSRDGTRISRIGNTPLEPWRSGDLSSFTGRLMDPLAGTPFAGNRIPASRISPVSQRIQEFFYPLPNFGGPALQAGNWRGQTSGLVDFTHYDDYTGRIDYNFSSRDMAFARGSYRRLPGPFIVAGLPPLGMREQLRQSSSGILSWTHILTSSTLNEFRMGFTRVANAFQAELIGRDILKQVGIEGIDIAEPLHAIPGISITGITSTSQPNPQTRNVATNFEWTDNLTRNQGKHSLKFGVDAIRDQVSGVQFPNAVYGTYSFNGTFTGHAYGDFLLGLPQGTSRQAPTPAQYLRGILLSFYAQDEFRVSRRLTLNYGFRWELETPYSELNGGIYGFDPASGSFVVPDDSVSRVNPLFPKNIPVVAASKVGFPDRTLMAFDKNNLFPRLGFAWQPFAGGKTSVRGGYGIYGNAQYGAAARSMDGGPYSGSETYTNRIVNGSPLFNFPRPFLASGATATQNGAGIDPNLRSPYTQQYNLTVERELGGVGLRVGYVGSRSVKLVYTRNLNQPPASTTPFNANRRPYPIYNNITWRENGGTQQYNSLQVSAQTHSNRGFTFRTGWTWAKDLTDTQDGGGFAGPSIENQLDRRSERGDNVLTRTHRFYFAPIWDLPFGQKRRFLPDANRFVQRILGGWSTAWTITAQSGEFFNPSFSGFDASGTNTTGGRPDRFGNGELTSGRSIDKWFDASAFAVPGCPPQMPNCRPAAPVGRFGNAGVNILRGPSSVNFSASMMKEFPIRERMRLQFRATASNVFNHPNFLLPAVNISSPGTVGVISGTYGEQTGEEARQVHFMLRLHF